MWSPGRWSEGKLGIVGATVMQGDRASLKGEPDLQIAKVVLNAQSLVWGCHTFHYPLRQLIIQILKYKVLWFSNVGIHLNLLSNHVCGRLGVAAYIAQLVECSSSIHVWILSSEPNKPCMMMPTGNHNTWEVGVRKMRSSRSSLATKGVQGQPVRHLALSLKKWVLKKKRKLYGPKLHIWSLPCCSSAVYLSSEPILPGSDLWFRASFVNGRFPVLTAQSQVNT